MNPQLLFIEMLKIPGGMLSFQKTYDYRVGFLASLPEMPDIPNNVRQMYANENMKIKFGDPKNENKMVDILQIGYPFDDSITVNDEKQRITPKNPVRGEKLGTVPGETVNYDKIKFEIPTVSNDSKTVYIYVPRHTTLDPNLSLNYNIVTIDSHLYFEKEEKDANEMAKSYSSNRNRNGILANYERERILSSGLGGGKSVEYTKTSEHVTFLKDGTQATRVVYKNNRGTKYVKFAKEWILVSKLKTKK
jgi:hypothetical protein